jgi:hypothetical protein
MRKILPKSIVSKQEILRMFDFGSIPFEKKTVNI